MDLRTLCFNCFKDKGTAYCCPFCSYEGSGRKEHANILSLGSILAGRYLVGRVLGAGGFGITYLGYDLKHQKTIAIKEYFPQQLAYRPKGASKLIIHPGEKREMFKLGINKFLDETNVLVNFRKNPHIINIHNFFKENGTAYYVMDYIQGFTLLDYMRIQERPLRLDEAIEVLAPLMDALDEVHHRGTLHRDISPDNIYITGQGKSLLLDFGAAKYNISKASRSMLAVLKQGYAPVEQYKQNMRQGPCTDIYALAATFYHVTTGIVPPESLDRQERDEIIAPTYKVAGMGRDLEAVLLKGLAILPQHRYQTAGDFKRDLIKTYNKGVMNGR